MKGASELPVGLLVALVLGMFVLLVGTLFLSGAAGSDILKNLPLPFKYEPTPGTGKGDTTVGGGLALVADVDVPAQSNKIAEIIAGVMEGIDAEKGYYTRKCDSQNWCLVSLQKFQLNTLTPEQRSALKVPALAAECGGFLDEVCISAYLDKLGYCTGNRLKQGFIKDGVGVNDKFKPGNNNCGERDAKPPWNDNEYCKKLCPAASGSSDPDVIVNWDTEDDSGKFSIDNTPPQYGARGYIMALYWDNTGNILSPPVHVFKAYFFKRPESETHDAATFGNIKTALNNACKNLPAEHKQRTMSFDEKNEIKESEDVGFEDADFKDVEVRAVYDFTFKMGENVPLAKITDYIKAEAKKSGSPCGTPNIHGRYANGIEGLKSENIILGLNEGSCLYSVKSEYKGGGITLAETFYVYSTEAEKAELKAGTAYRFLLNNYAFRQKDASNQRSDFSLRICKTGSVTTETAVGGTATTGGQTVSFKWKSAATSCTATTSTTALPGGSCQTEGSTACIDNQLFQCKA